jgi:hypothetical protein
MAFFRLGDAERAADLRAGIVASTIANVNRDPKKKPDAYQPADFMPLQKAAAGRDPKRKKKTGNAVIALIRNVKGRARRARDVQD